jgi:hypothetical protein
MDDFRLDPVAPSGSYGDRQQPGPGKRRKLKPPADEPAIEDEIVLAEPGESEGESENGDYYSPSGGSKAQE